MTSALSTELTLDSPRGLAAGFMSPELMATISSRSGSTMERQIGTRRSCAMGRKSALGTGQNFRYALDGSCLRNARWTVWRVDLRGRQGEIDLVLLTGADAHVLVRRVLVAARGAADGGRRGGRVDRDLLKRIFAVRVGVGADDEIGGHCGI